MFLLFSEDPATWPTNRTTLRKLRLRGPRDFPSPCSIFLRRTSQQPSGLAHCGVANVLIVQWLLHPVGILPSGELVTPVVAGTASRGLRDSSERC